MFGEWGHVSKVLSFKAKVFAYSKTRQNNLQVGMYSNTMCTLELIALQSSFTCHTMSCKQFLCPEIC